MNTFGENLSILREKEGLTMEQLSEALNRIAPHAFSKSMISRWENGSGYPRLDKVKIIAKFFNISIDNLIGFNKEDASLNSQLETSYRDAYKDKKLSDQDRASLLRSIEVAERKAELDNKNKTTNKSSISIRTDRDR